MKILKAHLDVVICAAVALIALGLWFWPTLSLDTDLQTAGTERYGQISGIKNLVGTIELPDGKHLERATVEPNVIKAGELAQKQMKEQAAKVAEIAANENQLNRVITVNGPAGAPSRLIPLLANKHPEDNFLPAIIPPANPFAFKTDFENQYPLWVAQMTGQPNLSGMPPSALEVAALINARIAEAAGNAAKEHAVMGGSQPGTAALLSLRDQNDIKRNAVFVRAGNLHMYVDDGALRKPDWPAGTPPTEPQIFEAFVYSWLQQDVVTAIVTVNNKVLDDKNLPAADKNVGHAPIKRLESIVIGNAAIGGSGSAGNASNLFLSASSPAAAGSPGLTPDGLDQSRSLTGHVPSKDYDVVMMKVVIDIDPAYQNQFIEALYRQNNGYTVLNWNLRTVDPLEAASNGYLYGPTQVVRVELLVEDILFRSWTTKLMPPSTLNALVPPYVAPTGK